MTNRLGFDENGQPDIPFPFGLMPADMSQSVSQARAYAVLLSDVWHPFPSGLRSTVPTWRSWNSTHRIVARLLRNFPFHNKSTHTSIQEEYFDSYLAKYGQEADYYLVLSPATRDKS